MCDSRGLWRKSAIRIQIYNQQNEFSDFKREEIKMFLQLSVRDQQRQWTVPSLGHHKLSVAILPVVSRWRWHPRTRDTQQLMHPQSFRQAEAQPGETGTTTRLKQSFIL
jgi:hypothetical protein